jgi:uncharacterized protein
VTGLLHISVLLQPSPPPRSALRTDVAGFVGRARRGPVGVARRVESWLEFDQLYGGVGSDAHLGWAVRAYFANGGELAYVVRVADSDARSAFAHLEENRDDGVTVTAASPGAWANDAAVTVTWRGLGRIGEGGWSVRVQPVGERPSTADLVVPDGDVPAITPLVLIDAGAALAEVLPIVAGSRLARTWTVTLQNGDDGIGPTPDLYRVALAALFAEPEVSLLGMPDLWSDLDRTAAEVILGEALAEADAGLDRLILIDLPASANESGGVGLRTARDLELRLDQRSLRAGAAYHPWLLVEDRSVRSGKGATRAVPPCGHVAGLASRLDRERGPSRTPANADLADVVDVAGSLDAAYAVEMTSARVNVIGCSPGRGVQVLGGRTLDPSPAGRLVAHRRLTHRLVRAMRRVAEPLVFEPNGPELWFALRRGITTVLLQAFRTGALRGGNPAEAFDVRCDARTVTPADREMGRVVCEVSFVAANPMEIITIRLLLAADGRLEVIEQ